MYMDRKEYPWGYSVSYYSSFFNGIIVPCLPGQYILGTFIGSGAKPSFSG